MAPGTSTRIVRGMGLRAPSQTGTSTTETTPSNGARRIYSLTPLTAQEALEAGNSPQISFGHYRELVWAMDAEKWFGITPASSGAAKAPGRTGRRGRSWRSEEH